jgi:hypothetical protein
VITLTKTAAVFVAIAVFYLTGILSGLAKLWRAAGDSALGAPS